MRLATPAIALLLWLCLAPVSPLACLYNVRDIGFVDLDSEQYRLYGFVRPDAPAMSISDLERGLAGVFRDCNVRIEIVKLGDSTNHIASKYLGQHGENALPTAALVSPDGHATRFALPEAGPAFHARLASTFEPVASSPARNEILRTVTRAFGAVLLIEGDDAADNHRARGEIAKAIEEVGMRMKTMPKSVANPPAVVTIDAAALQSESALLWSLGLAPTKTRQPRAAVLYGKARWIGPLMNGEEITLRNVMGILSIIGADCECGLDLAWTMGTRLLVRWDETTHSVAAKNLGFDPENPVVRMEISRILSRSGLSTAMTTSGQLLSRKPASALTSTDSTLVTPVLATIGGVAIATIAAGLFILWRRKR